MSNHITNNNRGFAIVKVLAGILILGGLVGWGVMSSGGNMGQGGFSPDDLYEVKRRTFDVNVIAEGELMAKEREEIRSPLERASEIIYLVKEGESVKEGDLLVKFNDSAMQDSLDQIELEVENLKDALTREKRDSDIEIAKEKTDLEAAEVNLELVKLELQKWKNGDVIQTQRDLALALEKAEREEKRAAENVVLSQQLYEQEFISEQELEDDQIRKLESTAATKTAKMKIEIYNKYTFLKEKQQKESDLSQAEARVNRARAELENVTQREESQVANAEFRLNERQERLAELKQELAATELRAPKDGLVIYATSVGRSRYSRDKPITEGATVKYNEAIIYLPDTSQMVASVKVHEAFLRYVAMDQSANITIEARPDTFVSGKVSKIAVAPEPTSWYDPNIREYRISIDLDQEVSKALELKPGMRANAKVHIEKVQQVLAVPVQSVETIGKRNFVYVLSEVADGEASKVGVRMTEVQLGRHSDTLVEIASGLTEKDQLLLRQPTSRELLNPGEFKKAAKNESKNRGSTGAGNKQVHSSSASSPPPKALLSAGGKPGGKLSGKAGVKKAKDPSKKGLKAGNPNKSSKGQGKKKRL